QFSSLSLDAPPTAAAFKPVFPYPTPSRSTETVAPTGYAIDPNPSRNVTVAAGANVTIGTTGDDAQDFHDPLGSISWEKRDTHGNLLDRTTVTLTPTPLPCRIRTFTNMDNT